MSNTPKFKIPKEEIDSFSESKRFCIGRSGYKSIRKILEEPGGKEFLDEKIAKMKAENHPLMKQSPITVNSGTLISSEV
ncbi:MAG: hypothetical protein E7671_00690 [Ruminococcaceae bacterium]|nr:hypothetical protein [Oscillospiraceae bacterium]